MSTGSSPKTDWRRKRRRQSPWRVVAAVLLALAVHVAYLSVVLFTGTLPPTGRERKPVTRPPTSVAVRPLTEDQWSRNRGKTDSKTQTTQKPRVQDKKPEEKKPETRPNGQVVDLAPGNEQEAPDAKYLAEHNNRVDKETRAREQTPFYRNAMPQRTAPQEQKGADVEPQAPRIAGNNGMGNDDRPLAEGGQKFAFEIPDIHRKNEVKVKTDPNTPGGVAVNNQNESDELSGNAKRLRIQPGDTGGEEEGSAGRVGSPGIAALMPSRAVMDKVVGAAPNDHLRDVDEGDGTLLNSREWKYASFFNRVKQSVGMHWKPNETLRRRDPTGNMFTGKDRHTMLEITLDEKGRVTNIEVEKSSGLDFLDMEAVSSFQRAQPFPNPPPGLLNDDSKVRFSFGFFLEMGGGPRMRLFRQPN
ncbi:energy transducer TonB [Myxococcus sp. CA051A]|uniref:Energy transducer TonB n=1 Tax=Myxococcus llanfairpwllgwyngyllgogerychwyrndrobwllllantysiliogogogochensis TaxID=2590453 RepID=A0A540X355_9BACT|nr:energy transducer TonB [Myxococcus llanfairpwllgwyngyllgogerychwyrndrobwllllantysiliogogogochensis]NTX14250.1 energy transducer TonB [Myxococcus sp. CA056]NTX35353.1 energy transducer TonB [Myxococcus sp. CA033]NTX51996.1 energy transducer TonB [Myxococcus sp. CA039A]NTX62232.1 energy transducer TonB [Myxococcus sp. CA051A]TQF15689.1 energy transducer TonB [Myxococcus llanfairpwllgwyngyllgogerychwyrndrobwllllantysiliogogogochensis]